MNELAQRRRDAVARILRSREVGTQEELLEALESAGFRATQATLSRDLARLGARRVSRPEGGTVYELDGAPVNGAATGGGLAALRALVAEIDANASLVVIRTHPGSAPMIARAIDLAGIREVLGTIAGDDTIFVAPAGELRPRKLAVRLAEPLGIPQAMASQRRGGPVLRAEAGNDEVVAGSEPRARDWPRGPAHEDARVDADEGVAAALPLPRTAGEGRGEGASAGRVVLIINALHPPGSARHVTERAILLG